jgi:hypothetical protein
VRGDAARLGNNLAALDIVALNTAQQQTQIVTRHALIEHLVEHFHARHHRCTALGLQTNDLNRFTDFDLATIDLTRLPPCRDP